MADEEKIYGASSRGDWEHVALTASVYAASPRPEGGLQDDFKNKEFHKDQESSSAVFLSEHFVFPPHEHENLPVEKFSDRVISQPGAHDMPTEEELRYFLYELNEDSSGVGLCVPNAEYQEDQTKKSFHTENDFRDDMSPNFVQFGKTGDDKSDGNSLPSEAWWKRHAMSLYKQVKETDKFWSICMAAALMGLVVLGQQWKKEKLHFQQFKLQFGINNERLSKLFGSVYRFKDALIHSRHHCSVIPGSAASNL